VETTLAQNGEKDATKFGEHQIGFAVFENYSPDSSAVRTNATSLRSRIDQYYTEFGTDDLVRIDVPAGGYRAVFSYNRSSPADKYYRRGLLDVRNFVPSQNRHSSLRLFAGAIQADGRHGLALAAKAEAELREGMYKWTPKRNPVAAAEEAALGALHVQPELWRAHVVMGAVHCCRHDWAQATSSFDAALAIAPQKTREHSWYSGFLLATGNEPEALRLARARVDDQPEDLPAQVALALFLYVTRRFREAEEVAREAIANYPEECPESWLAHIIMACVSLATGDAFTATLWMRNVDDLIVQRYSFFFNVFVGLFALSHFLSGAEGADRRVRKWLSDRWSSPYWTPVQVALSYLGLGETEMAIEALTQAVEESDPLMVWLHLWPLFDPLRGERGFQNLINRLDIPRLRKRVTS
jgi:tetratricopeptide (TPR) repeat protein